MEAIEQMQDMKWQWIPGEQVGPIRLGAPIESLEGIFEGGLEIELEETSLMGPNYKDHDGNWSIAVENGHIDYIGCEKWCYYKGINLVGMEVGDCLELLGASRDQKIDYIEEWDDFDQHFYQVDPLGATIIAVNGVVVEFFADEIFAEDEETVIHPFRDQVPD